MWTVMLVKVTGAHAVVWWCEYPKGPHLMSQHHWRGVRVSLTSQGGHPEQMDGKRGPKHLDAA